MRRARVTFQGAYHHVMNRGFNGLDIFEGNTAKARFLDYLVEASQKLDIRIFAYCIMENHYHLVLENTSGKMSDFLKLLNGNYGMYYRKTAGGVGYVFQNRYKSTLIENDSYLIQSILYLMKNPIRAGIVKSPELYLWSSGGSYFSTKPEAIVDREYVNDLFGSKDTLYKAMESLGEQRLSYQITKFGEVLGDVNFIKLALKKFDRRKRPTDQSHGVKRVDERYVHPKMQIIQEFEAMHGIEIDNLDTTNFKGKRLRGELLVLLKDAAGLKYKDIAGIEIFSDLSFNSLGSIYRNSKRIRDSK